MKPRTKVTLEVDSALVAAAGAKGVDLASVFERALKSALQPVPSMGLSNEDLASIEDYNRFVGEHGTLADALRKI